MDDGTIVRNKILIDGHWIDLVDYNDAKDIFYYCMVNRTRLRLPFVKSGNLYHGDMLEAAYHNVLTSEIKPEALQEIKSGNIKVGDEVTFTRISKRHVDVYTRYTDIYLCELSRFANDEVFDEMLDDVKCERRIFISAIDFESNTMFLECGLYSTVTDDVKVDDFKRTSTGQFIILGGTDEDRTTGKNRVENWMNVDNNTELELVYDFISKVFFLVNKTKEGQKELGYLSVDDSKVLYRHHVVGHKNLYAFLEHIDRGGVLFPAVRIYHR